MDQAAIRRWPTIAITQRVRLMLEVPAARSRPRSVGVLLGGLGLALAASACGTAGTERTATPAEPGVTTGAAPDRSVARTDVDGDGAADTVYYRVRSADVARVVVRTSSGQRLVRGLSTKFWPRGQWYGATPLDGVPGDELVVGTWMGAHTPMFTVLTYRFGDLEVMDNPAGIYGRLWPIDAFYNGYLGWTRTVEDGEVRLTLRSVLRTGQTKEFTGEAEHFRWAGNGWVRAGVEPISVRGDKRAAQIGGWHVKGLPSWPPALAATGA